MTFEEWSQARNLGPNDARILWAKEAWNAALDESAKMCAGAILEKPVIGPLYNAGWNKACECFSDWIGKKKA